MAKRNLFYLLLGATTGGGGGTDTSDATATPADIRLDKTAYGAEGKMIGTIPDYDGTTEPTSGKSLFARLVDRSITEVTASNLEGATIIGASAFRGCSQLSTVVVADSVKSTGGDAFYNCVAMTSITMPSVTNVGGATLYGCSKLVSVVLGSAVARIDARAFSGVGTDASEGCAFTIQTVTPPIIQSNTFEGAKINKIIVPKGSGDAYKAATNWSALADYIEEAGD